MIKKISYFLLKLLHTPLLQQFRISYETMHLLGIWQGTSLNFRKTEFN